MFTAATFAEWMLFSLVFSAVFGTLGAGLAGVSWRLSVRATQAVLERYGWD